VFSQTSFQLRKISPQRPRAIYFNDDVYVGWVRGGGVVATVEHWRGEVSPDPERSDGREK